VIYNCLNNSNPVKLFILLRRTCDQVMLQNSHKIFFTKIAALCTADETQI